MAKHVSIRLWDEVLAAVDKKAAAEERDRSQVINMVLRDALVCQEVGQIAKAGRETWEGTLVPKAATKANSTNVTGLGLDAEKISEKPASKSGKCEHGNVFGKCVYFSCKGGE